MSIKLAMSINGRTVSAEVEDQEIRRSRAALLVRARTMRSFSRDGLVKEVKRKTNLDLTARFIQRIEAAEVLNVSSQMVSALERALSLDEGTLLVPPVVAAHGFSRLAELLRTQGNVYGSVYAKRFEDLLSPVRDFAVQLGRGVVTLPAPESEYWLEDLYRSAHKIQAVAVTAFIARASSNLHWARIMESQDASRARKCSIERVYVVDKQSRASAAWRDAFNRDNAEEKRAIEKETAELIVTTMAADEGITPLVDGAVDPLDFAIVDGAVIGLTAFDKAFRSEFHFGNLDLVHKYERVFKALWAKAEKLQNRLTPSAT
jgi:hypothetical protein